jgi:dUTP pyrophosphatase
MIEIVNPVVEDKNVKEDLFFSAKEIEKLKELVSPKTIDIRYHNELFPELKPIEQIEKGDWIDLRCAATTTLKAGSFVVIPLGVSMKLPKDCFAIVSPRSSTFKKYGIIMANSIGIIDESYCGDNDIWGFPAYATRDIEIPVNERICQFTIVNKMNVSFNTVDRLADKDRGGFGSTGRV